MSSSDDEELNELNNTLRRLKIDVRNTERQIADINRRKELERVNNNNANPHKTQDKYGKVFHIGDVVEFLTKGAYTTTHGIVIRITQYRVTALDNRDNRIVRAPHNLKIIRRIPQENFKDAGRRTSDTGNNGRRRGKRDKQQQH